MVWDSEISDCVCGYEASCFKEFEGVCQQFLFWDLGYFTAVCIKVDTSVMSVVVLL